MDLGPALPEAALMAARRLPAKPDGAVLTGRFVRLVPYDVETHLVGTYEALSGMSSFGHPSYDATTLVWQYLRSVKCPVSTMDDMEHTLKRVRDLGDARLFVVQLLPSWTELAAAKDASAAAAAEGPIIGVVAYLANRPADLAIEIGMVAYTPAFQGTPVNTEATYLLLRHALELGYRRVEWKCNSLNERSKAAALRIGFAYEGTHRCHMIVGGAGGSSHSRDTAWFSMLADEWREKRAVLEGWLAGDAPVALFQRRRAALAAMAGAKAEPV